MRWRDGIVSLIAGILLCAANPAIISAQDDAFPVPTEDSTTEAVPVTTNEDAVAEPSNETSEEVEPTESVIPTSPTEVILALKYWSVPFILATLITIWFSTERLVVLRNARVIPKPFVERFIHHLQEGSVKPDEAEELCRENGSPVAQIFAHGVRKWGKPSVEVEQAIIDGGERQVSELRKHLRVLNGVATVSPLIGLLGTVWGMIEAFNGLAGGTFGGNPEQLAAGIALALLTTAVGLAIAIPALIIYMYLSGRVDQLVMEMDRLAQEVVYLISAEALQSAPQRQKVTRAG